jgi:hypothetical protein
MIYIQATGTTHIGATTPGVILLNLVIYMKGKNQDGLIIRRLSPIELVELMLRVVGT